MFISVLYDLVFHTITGISLFAVYLVSKLHTMKRSNLNIYFYLSYFLITFLIYELINYIFLGYPLPTFNLWMIIGNLFILLCGWNYAQTFLKEYAAI